MKRILIQIIAAAATLNAAAQTDTPVYLNTDAPLEERVQDALSRMTLHEKVQILHAQSKFSSAGVPRLGIRQLNMSDGPHGVREEIEWNSWSPARWTNDSCVAFPSLTCLAATWNRDLVRQAGTIVGREARALGYTNVYAPILDLARDPRWGRTLECYGEDPYLVAELGTEMARGIQSQGVASTLKHYAVYSVPKGGRDGDCRTDPHVAPRELHQLYLYPFRRVVREARPMGVMSSYNDWDGVPATRSCSSTSPTASAASRPTSRSCADLSASASSPGRRVASPSA